MSYLIDIKEIISKKSREIIFLTQDGNKTTNIKEAGIWEDQKTEKMVRENHYAICPQESLKYFSINNDKATYNKYVRKHIQVF